MCCTERARSWNRLHRRVEKADAIPAEAQPWRFREAAMAARYSPQHSEIPRLRQSRARNSCELVADERNLLALQVQGDQRGHEYDDGERKQQALVALDFDAEQRQVAQDGSGGSARGEQRSEPSESWRQEQNRCDKFHDAGT